MRIENYEKFFATGAEEEDQRIEEMYGHCDSRSQRHSMLVALHLVKIDLLTSAILNQEGWAISDIELILGFVPLVSHEPDAVYVLVDMLDRLYHESYPKDSEALQYFGYAVRKIIPLRQQR